MNNNKMYFFSAENMHKATEHKKKLDKMEDLERSLCDVAVDELTIIVNTTKEINCNPEDVDVKRLMLVSHYKDSAAKTMLLIHRISSYAGIKRGVLPQDKGNGGAEPRSDIKKAEDIVNRAEKNLMRVVPKQ